MSCLLSIENLRHRYAESDWALDVPNLGLAPGEFVGLIGPNGTGKSTLLRAAAGILQPDEGRVLLDGADLRQILRRGVARRLGYLPQTIASVFDQDVYDVVRMGRYAHQRGAGRLTAADRHAIACSLERTETTALQSRPLSHLSGGERQRVLLASILAQEPAVMLLDEPTAALDINHQIRFYRLLRDLTREGLAVAVVTHQLNLAAQFCSRLVLLHGGRIVADGDPARVVDAQRLRRIYGDEITVAAHPLAIYPGALPPLVLPCPGVRRVEDAQADASEKQQDLLPVGAAVSCVGAPGRPTSRSASPTSPPPRTLPEAPSDDAAAPAESGRTTSSPAPRRMPGPAHLAGYAGLFLAAMTLCPLIGNVGLGSGEVEDISFIAMQLRLPRVVLAGVIGGALAAAGAALQALLRNPLAEPYTLGISAGASLGAVVAFHLPAALVFSIGFFKTQHLLALLGAAGATALIWMLARREGGIAVTTLLLAGVTLGIICAGLITLVRYIADPLQLKNMDLWLMGHLEVVGWQQTLSAGVLILPGLALLAGAARALDHLALDEELAAGHGVEVSRAQTSVFFGAAIATGAAVAVAGPIGFVGLIVPHAVRRLSGTRHPLVLPGSFLLGGAVLAVCDTVGRTVRPGTELPVGVITALVGGPVFMLILLQRRAA